jgi:hypothetical protein
MMTWHSALWVRSSYDLVWLQDALADAILWSGWTFVGTIAQILSLITLITAAVQFAAGRRRFSRVRLTWRVVGTRMVDGRDHLVPFAREKHHVYVLEVHNVGRTALAILALDLVGAYAHITDENQTPSFLAVGESYRLLIETPDIGNAWIRSSAQSQDDRYRVTVFWGPIVGGGQLGKQAQIEASAWRKRSPRKRLVDRVRGVVVGPGGAPFSHYQDSRASSNRTRTILANPDGTSRWFHTRRYTNGVPDLPYLGPDLS